MCEMLSTPEAKELIHLCKTGRLFDVQEWIASGKSLRFPPTIKTSPLRVALDTGFHSLVDLLARHEASQELKNRALSHAVNLKRLDLVQLLVLHGADIRSVPFVDVLDEWEPTIIRYFIDQGADLITGSPFAVAFSNKIRTALRPWKECMERFPDRSRQLQEQADRTLRHFCFKGDLKWVSLLLWAGADPRSSGPWLDENDDEEEYMTALEAAAYSRDPKILKRVKPDAKKDNLNQLLTITCGGARTDVARYLLELGAQPNDKPNGGSSALENALTYFDIESFRHDYYSGIYYRKSKADKYSVSKTRATVELLLEHGALWRPDNAGQVTQVRRGLLQCEPDVTLELVTKMRKYSATNPETIQELLRTPAMKDHIAQIARMFLPIGMDVRTRQQKAEDQRQEERARQWAIQHLASRYNREEIYQAIWAEPIQHVAKRYNMSDVGLAKICKKLNIPRPGRGYWAIKAAGKPLPKQPPLHPLSRPPRPSLTEVAKKH